MSSPLGVLFSPAVGVADTGFEQSRPFSTKPHTDGLLIVGPGGISVSGTPAPVLTRSGNGRWGLVATATGADTYFFRTTVGAILRTGEHFQFGGFGADAQDPTTPPKGFGIVDAFAIFGIGVVNLTSATLRIGQTVYSATLVPVQTDIVAATAVGSLVVAANPLAQVLPVPPSSQVYNTADLDLVEVELSAVLANTGTLTLEAMGFHIAFNLN